MPDGNWFTPPPPPSSSSTLIPHTRLPDPHHIAPFLLLRYSSPWALTEYVPNGLPTRSVKLPLPWTILVVLLYNRTVGRRQNRRINSVLPPLYVLAQYSVFSTMYDSFDHCWSSHGLTEMFQATERIVHANTERSTSEESVLLGRCEELVFEPDEPAGLSWRGCGV